jgi:hypothetical protein
MQTSRHHVQLNHMALGQGQTLGKPNAQMQQQHPLGAGSPRASPLQHLPPHGTVQQSIEKGNLEL